MKQTKRRLELMSFYDRTGITAHLEKMAAKGWMLEKITGTGWIYRRIVPKELTFAVTYYPRGSEFDPGPTEDQQVYHDYSAHSGWQFLCSSGQMQIFCTEREHPTPLETDPMLELETMHRAAKKGFFLPYGILLLLGLLQATLFVLRLLGDPISILASTTNLTTGLIWTLLLILVLTEFLLYYHWRSRAKKAAARGEFLDTPSASKLQKMVLGIALIGFCYWLLNVLTAGDPLMGFVAILMLAYMFVLIVLVNGTKQFLKRKKASRGLNLTLTLVVDVILAFGMMAAVVYGTIRLANTGIFDGGETYEHRGHTHILYQDDVPLRVEDMIEIDYDGYVRERRTEESVFLAQIAVHEWPRFDDEAGRKIPGLDYTVTIIKAPFLYELCREQIWADQDETNDDRIPEGFKRVYLPVDAQPWGSEEAYRLTYQDTGPTNEYLLCYEDRIIEITFAWEPTEAQMAVVYEKLCT